MAKFQIFIDTENCLAIRDFPDDRTDEEIRVTSISTERDRTIFVLPNGRQIVVSMPFGEIIQKLKAPGLNVEGTEYAHRT